MFIRMFLKNQPTPIRCSNINIVLINTPKGSLYMSFLSFKQNIHFNYLNIIIIS